MYELPLSDDVYVTPQRCIGLARRLAPSACFYPFFLWIIYKASRLAKRGLFDNPTWARYAQQVIMALEDVGIRFSIEGIDNLRQLTGPCVIVANHMSMMETIVAPGIILPFTPITFVVKRSLLRYPVFRHVLGACNPIAVTRTDPRQDLQSVLTQGPDRLSKGTSVMAFPQTTRTTNFDLSSFNTIGIKLARKAGVPVMPLALRTDAWRNGRLIKDMGLLDVRRPVHMAFGRPIYVEGRGLDQHRQVIDFIQQRLTRWLGEGKVCLTEKAQ
ncbi:MAG: lysophospholipid acyltransferase family protein [Sedimentisphaerales bacterium]|jgi:1-acyl-sn-glycerol-3-phosphate acyltransferase|nr:lysophospholipid acyltransferase family protein [Sedimentisphaerales bacterium]